MSNPEKPAAEKPAGERPATKRAFLDRLASCLAALEPGDRANTVEFYCEQIDDRIDDGMTEAQAVASLEAPEDIAANILAMKAEAAEKTAGTRAEEDSGTGASEGSGSLPPNARFATEPGGAGTDGTGQGAKQGAGRNAARRLKKALVICAAAIGAIVLLPIACGIACVLVAVCAALWAGVAALAAAGLGCALFCVVVAVGCIADPVADATVLLANIAIIMGTAGLAPLLGLAAFGIGKLLVRLIVWIARGIGRLARGTSKPTAPQADSAQAADPVAPADPTAPAAAKDYPSMPLPPLTPTGQTAKKPRKRMPAWGALALTGTLLVVLCACTGLGSVLASGGIDALLERAGISRFVNRASLQGNQVDVIDLSPQGQLCEQLTVYLGVSPDEDIHVISAGPQACMAAWCGARQTIEARQTNAEVEFFSTTTPSAGVQNFLTALNTIRRTDVEPNSVTVLLPAGWNGTLTCDDASIKVETAWSHIEDELRLDGTVDLHANYVNLYQVDAADLWIDADCVYLSYIAADHLRVNADRSKSGYAWLTRVQANRAELGGRRIEYEDFDVKQLEASVGTTLCSYDDDPGEAELAKDLG